MTKRALLGIVLPAALLLALTILAVLTGSKQLITYITVFCFVVTIVGSVVTVVFSILTMVEVNRMRARWRREDGQDRR